MLKYQNSLVLHEYHSSEGVKSSEVEFMWWSSCQHVFGNLCEWFPDRNPNKYMKKYHKSNLTKQWPYTCANVQIDWFKHSRNYASVLLCVGVECGRKSQAMCHLLLTPQRLMISIDRLVSLAASISTSVSHWLVLRGPSLSQLLLYTLSWKRTHAHINTFSLAHTSTSCSFAHTLECDVLLNTHTQCTHNVLDMNCSMKATSQCFLC